MRSEHAQSVLLCRRSGSSCAVGTMTVSLTSWTGWRNGKAVVGAVENVAADEEAELEKKV